MSLRVSIRAVGLAPALLQSGEQPDFSVLTDLGGNTRAGGGNDTTMDALLNELHNA